MIGSAIIINGYLRIYDTLGSQLSETWVGTDAKIQGYNTETVSVLNNNYLYIYNKYCSQLSSNFVG